MKCLLFLVIKIRITFKTILWELWASYSGLNDNNNLLKVLRNYFKRDTDFWERVLVNPRTKGICIFLSREEAN